jgi:DNA-directed RNA polymerase specialized sigma24 family protein
MLATSPASTGAGKARLIEQAQKLTEGLARTFSFKYNIPLDDLRQETALAILEATRRCGTLPPSDGFLYTVVRNHFLNVAKRARRHAVREGLSLDTPCSEYDGASTYSEILMDEGPSLDDTVLYLSVQRAVRALPADEQRIISERYTGHMSAPYPPYHRTADVTRRAAFRHLKKALRSELQEGSLTPVCDTVGCQNEATTFDGEQIMFVCGEHHQKAEAWV